MFTTLKSFKFWCNKVLPVVYDDSLSYYEVLCKLTDYINKMIENQNDMADVLIQYGLTIDQIKKDVAFLNSEMEKVRSGKYVSLYLDSLKNWIDENLQKIVADLVKFVTFGLSDDGHFVAYIPTHWNFLKFDTVYDSSSDLYGHLILKY